MKKYHLVLIVILGVFLALLLLIAGLSIYSNISFNLRYENAEYCYSAMMGSWFYSSSGSPMIPGKICVCEGDIIYPGCPLGASCDGFEARCDGQITGFQYVIWPHRFDTLDEYKEYCNTLGNDSLGLSREGCLKNANIIELTESFIESGKSPPDYETCRYSGSFRWKCSIYADDYDFGFTEMERIRKGEIMDSFKQICINQGGLVDCGTSVFCDEMICSFEEEYLVD